LQPLSNEFIFHFLRHKKKREKGESTDKIQFSSRVEKEYLKPSYSASIGEELEDGLFDGISKSVVLSICI
jgi:hypothetical protein